MKFSQTLLQLATLTISQQHRQPVDSPILNSQREPIYSSTMADQTDSHRSLATRIKDKFSSSSHRHSPTSTATTDTPPPADGSAAARTDRGKLILEVFDSAFRHLMKNDKSAIQTKYRKMAGSAFAFYRGSAPLFYRDLEPESETGPYLDERTSRIWIHGDLHAENFGTYSMFFLFLLLLLLC